MSAPAEAGYAASFAQTGIWLNERLGTAHTTYHLPLTIAFDGAIDADALRQAVSALIERHPLLAMSVEERDGVILLPSRPRPHRAGAARRRTRRRSAAGGADPGRGGAAISSGWRPQPHDPDKGQPRSLLLIVAHHSSSTGNRRACSSATSRLCISAAATGSAPQLPDLPATHDSPKLMPSLPAGIGRSTTASRPK